MHRLAWFHSKTDGAAAGVNRLFYRRVSQWIRFVVTFPTIGLSEVVVENLEGFRVLVFHSSYDRRVALSGSFPRWLWEQL